MGLAVAVNHINSEWESEAQVPYVKEESNTAKEASKR